MCAAPDVLAPQALTYCYDYDFLIQLLFKSYKVILSLQHAAWEKETNNKATTKKINKRQKNIVYGSTGSRSVRVHMHTYICK